MLPNPRNYIFAALVFLMLAACASIPAPQTPAQQLAYAESTLTGVIDSAATLTASGRLDVEQARKVQAETARIEGILKHSRVFIADGLPDLALDRLQLAQRALLQLDNHLKEKALE